MPSAPHQLLIRAARSGYVVAIHAEFVGLASMLLGAGRDRVEDSVDPAVGVIVQARLGDAVKRGDPLAEVHYRAETRLGEAVTLLRDAWRIGDTMPVASPLILQCLDFHEAPR